MNRTRVDVRGFQATVTFDGLETWRVDLGELPELIPQLAPIRVPSNTYHQRTRPSWYWMESVDELVTCRTRLAERNLRLLDFYPSLLSLAGDVVAICAEPFQLHTDEEAARGRTPDFLVTLSTGNRAVVDIVSNHRAGQAATQRHLRIMALACERLGFEHVVCGEPDSTLNANIVWLRGYARRMDHLHGLKSQVLENACEPQPLRTLVANTPHPVIALPAAYHLLWQRRLAFDLTRPLMLTSEIWRTDP